MGAVSRNKYRALERKNNTLFHVLRQYEEGLRHALGGHTNKKAYEYIPSDVEHFFPRVMSAKAVFLAYRRIMGLPQTKEDKSRKHGGRVQFLDIGCGPGGKVVLADGLPGISGWGLEYNKETYAFAARMAVADRIILGDCRTFKQYAEFDILHFYVPLEDTKEEVRFEEHLYKTMAVGAVVASIGSVLRASSGQLPKNVHDVDLRTDYSYRLLIKVAPDFPANELNTLRREANKTSHDWGRDY